MRNKTPLKLATRKFKVCPSRRASTNSYKNGTSSPSPSPSLTASVDMYVCGCGHARLSCKETKDEEPCKKKRFYSSSLTVPRIFFFFFERDTLCQHHTLRSTLILVWVLFKVGGSAILSRYQNDVKKDYTTTWRETKWVLYLLFWQRFTGHALTWWWTHPDPFPCQKSKFL